MLRVLTVAAVSLVVLAAGANSEARRPANASDPCVAASAPVNYGRLLNIPDAVKSEIEAYRQGWKEACAKKGGASLAALLARGDKIGKALGDVLDKSGLKETKFDDLHTLLQETYPRFIPAFHGSVIEYDYFEPDLVAFARKAALGDADDKLFFAQQRALYGTDGHAFPWVKRSWDHGGCVLWGRYDWVAAVARIEDLEGKLKAPAYRTRLAALKERIKGYVSAPAAKRDGKKPVVDSCAPRAQTIAALEKTMRGFQTRKGWEATAAGLKKTLDDIRANRTEICNDCLR
jgi:hypothetical protein